MQWRRKRGVADSILLSTMCTGTKSFGFNPLKHCYHVIQRQRAALQRLSRAGTGRGGCRAAPVAVAVHSSALQRQQKAARSLSTVSADVGG